MGVRKGTSPPQKKSSRREAKAREDKNKQKTMTLYKETLEPRGDTKTEQILEPDKLLMHVQVANGSSLGFDGLIESPGAIHNFIPQQVWNSIPQVASCCINTRVRDINGEIMEPLGHVDLIVETNEHKVASQFYFRPTRTSNEYMSSVTKE